MAEQGHFVVYLYQGPRIMTWLSSLDSLLTSEKKQKIFDRIKDLAQLFLAIYKIKGAKTKEYAYEMMLNVPELRAAFSDLNFEGFEQLLNSKNKLIGVYSLNHALIQLLLNKDIDMKEALDTSVNPEQLEDLLKKMGL